MKIKHTQLCPICREELRQDQFNPLYPLPPMQISGQVFICCAPLADDPLHYYSHMIKEGEPEWIISQEFSVDIGSRYVIFNNDYQLEKSSVKSNNKISPLEMPILLMPDFPNLENLVKKIRLSITFS